MIRRPPKSTLVRSSAASDVYKGQLEFYRQLGIADAAVAGGLLMSGARFWDRGRLAAPVSYTHLRAHETVLDLVCRLLLEKKKRRDALG